jgi:hypothetical protein
MANINLEVETMNPKTVIKLNIEDGYYDPAQIAELYRAMVNVLEITQADIKITDMSKNTEE